MPKVQDNTSSNVKKRRRTLPGRTPEERENTLIGLAVDLTEQKLRDGTAPAQLIVPLLNLATKRAALELEKLRSETEVARAKVDTMRAQERSEEAYEKVLAALRRYNGDDEEDEYDD